ncbi:MAG TPA: ATP synthase F0 subunit B [Thermodesulfobacteriota bacterium]|nr:ATP synthase F0 subunit B [Deltaproteobacteria bacterium]HNU70681.1 ATP synthase F0 subunit B [Thermodesulfobacteriota bacterium]
MFSPYEILGLKVIPGLLLVQGVIFLIVVWVLNSVLFKPLLSVLREREEKTEGFIREADTTEQKAQATLKDYETRFRQARKEALEIKKKYIAEGADVRHATLDQARKEAAVSLEGMRGTIAKEAEAARVTLRMDMETLGRSLAEKVLGRSISL